eukprot:jgi/Chrzof1/6870/Cz02g01170.t1
MSARGSKLRDGNQARRGSLQQLEESLCSLMQTLAPTAQDKTSREECINQLNNALKAAAKWRGVDNFCALWFLCHGSSPENQ